MRVVYLGSGDIGLPVLQWLGGAAGVELAGVVTQPDRPAGRGLQSKPCAIKELAVGFGVPVLQPERIRRPDAVAEIAALRPDLLSAEQKELLTGRLPYKMKKSERRFYEELRAEIAAEQEKRASAEVKEDEENG